MSRFSADDAFFVAFKQVLAFGDGTSLLEAITLSCAARIAGGHMIVDEHPFALEEPSPTVPEEDIMAASSYYRSYPLRLWQATQTLHDDTTASLTSYVVVGLAVWLVAGYPFCRPENAGFVDVSLHVCIFGTLTALCVGRASLLMAIAGGHTVSKDAEFNGDAFTRDWIDTSMSAGVVAMQFGSWVPLAAWLAAVRGAWWLLVAVLKQAFRRCVTPEQQ